MAVIKLLRSSQLLNNQIGVSVILPDQIQTNEKLPVVWLFHGLGDNGTGWQRKTNLEQIVSTKRIAIVMPDMQRSFYTNMVYGGNYWEYLVKELIPQMRNYFPLATDAKENFLVGNSMGGYGVLKLALHHPTWFKAVAAISPVTDLQVVPKIMPDYQAVFGNELTNPKYQLKDMFQTANLDQLQQLSWYVAIGDADFMKQPCDDFVHDLSAQKLPINYVTGPGDHNWDYWNDQIKQVLNWLPLEQRGEH